MTDRSTPVDVAIAYLNAFGNHDMTTAANYIADEIVFESPRAKITGRQAYLDAVGQFSEAVMSVDIIAAFGDDDRALVMYDMKTGPFGTLRAADHFVVRDGKITSNLLVFDTYEVRKAE